MVKNKFVVLFGPKGISKEYNKKEKAIKLAKEIRQAYPRKQVEVDKITIHSKNHWDQYTIKTIPKKRK